MSAKLLFLANYKFILALDADDNMKQTFLPTLASDAMSRKYLGYINVVISIHMDKFSVNIDRKRHFLMSASKFLP